MLIIKITSANSNQFIKKAILVLENGGVIVYPTETAYGLGADFFNPKAMKKVYRIKGRDYKKPLSVIVSSLTMAKRLVKFNQLSLKLAKQYWPGALTLVLPIPSNNQPVLRSSTNATAEGGQGTNNFQSFGFARDKFPVSNFQTVGLRISSNKLATAIVKKFERPITATSANIAGQKECYSISEVIKQFANKKYQPDLIIDAGRLPKKKMSTIVKVTDGQLEVLRKGGLSI